MSETIKVWRQFCYFDQGEIFKKLVQNTHDGLAWFYYDINMVHREQVSTFLDNGNKITESQWPIWGGILNLSFNALTDDPFGPTGAGDWIVSGISISIYSVLLEQKEQSTLIQNGYHVEENGLLRKSLVFCFADNHVDEELPDPLKVIVNFITKETNQLNDIDLLLFNCRVPTTRFADTEGGDQYNVNFPLSPEAEA